MLERLLFGAITDDDTGASDLAEMLAERGIATLQVIDLPNAEQFMEWTRAYQAVVMAEGARNLPADEAWQRTRQALQLLRLGDPRTIAIKYCRVLQRV
jgi:3-dehydrotetronate 4-kinase